MCLNSRHFADNDVVTEDRSFLKDVEMTVKQNQVN